MGKWLPFIIAGICWLWALAQIRMVMIYWGKLDSPAIGFYKGGEPNPVLSAIAIRAVITFIVFGFVFFFIPWPKVFTYITAILVLRGIIDIILCSLRCGQYTVDISVIPEKAKQHLVTHVITTKIWIVLFFGVCLYFFGF